MAKFRPHQNIICLPPLTTMFCFFSPRNKEHRTLYCHLDNTSVSVQLILILFTKAAIVSQIMYVCMWKQHRSQSVESYFNMSKTHLHTSKKRTDPCYDDVYRVLNIQIYLCGDEIKLSFFLAWSFFLCWKIDCYQLSLLEINCPCW